MAQSKCLGCGTTRFELKEIEPIGSNFKFFAIQCASCGGVAGITDYINNGKILLQIKKKLGIG